MSVEMSETGLPELFAALAKAQGEMTGAAKDGKAEKGSSRERSYATLQSALEAVRGPLTANGVAVTQWCSDEADRVVVSTMLTHAAGGWMRSTMGASTAGLQQRGVQAVGATITYLRRYTLMAACGIAPDDDDDGSSADAARRAPREAHQARPAPRGEHHPEWSSGGNKRFCARLGEVGLTYEQAADYLQQRGRPRPSWMPPEEREKALAWLVDNAEKIKGAA